MKRYKIEREDFEEFGLDEHNDDEPISFWEELNTWFYEGYEEFFEKMNITPTLRFKYKTLLIECVQTPEHNRVSIRTSGGKNEHDLAVIYFSASNIHGYYINKEKALKNKYFMELMEYFEDAYFVTNYHDVFDDFDYDD